VTTTAPRPGAGRDDWLDEGLRLVASLGAPALTLDRICARMALTKGAFYHHFGSVPKFRMALLDWYEQRRTGAVIEAAGSLGPRDRLLRLLDEALKDTDDAAGPDLEVAIRAWANQDPQAAEMQERVDARRVGYLRELLAGLGTADPLRTATVVYVTMIGAAHLVPPLPKQEPRGLYEKVLLPLL
jgi:AcrR family transcriptional regulator